MCGILELFNKAKPESNIVFVDPGTEDEKRLLRAYHALEDADRAAAALPERDTAESQKA